MSYKTEQEEFWAGDFGDGYIERNNSLDIVASNTAFFSMVMRRCSGVGSVIEFGSNVGMNIKALKNILPTAEYAAVEINDKACKSLALIDGLDVNQCSILDFKTDRRFNLSLIKGVLIHINPEMLPVVYEALYTCSDRYVVIAEYYNSTPVEVVYRGNTGKLFKRDFAGEMLEKYPDLHLLDYGFCYKRDPVFPQDDITWFLLEKR